MKVDKDIPLPEGLRGKWALLGEIGDSVFIEDRKDRTRYLLSANVWGRKQKPRRKFRTYYETDGGDFVSRYNDADGIVGVRLWRVE